MNDTDRPYIRRIRAGLQLAPVLVPVALITLGIVATVLLLLGQFQTWILLCIGPAISVMTVMIAYAAVRDYTLPGKRRERFWIDTIVLLGILLWAGLNMPFSSQHVLTDRDPATYLVTGAWLMRHSNLHLIKPADFSTLPTMTAESLGFSTSTLRANELYAQGSHFLPALLGLLGRVCGMQSIFYGNVIFGAVALLAFYGFVRLILKPRWAALAALTLAVSLPFISFSRDSYTEPLALLCICSALTLLHYALKSGRLGSWLVASVGVGGAALIRPDAYLSIAAIEVYLVIWLARAPRRERKRASLQAIILAVPVSLLLLLGWLDLSHLSSGYYHDLRPQIIAQLACIIGVAALAGPIIRYFWDTKRRQRIHLLVTSNISLRIFTATLMSIFAGLFIRAIWLCTMAYLGKEQTMSVRLYSDHTTVLWICWYIGPVLALTGIGMFIYIWRGLLQGKTPELLPLMLVLSADCALYLLNPRISPDQIWASRRFLPVIFPGFIICGMLALQYIQRWQRQVAPLRCIWIERMLICCTAGAVIVPALTSIPFWRTRAFAEESQITAICRSIPKQSIIVWAGRAGAFNTEPIAALCGISSVSTVATGAGLAALLPHLRHIARARRKQLYIGVDTEDEDLLPAVKGARSTYSLHYTEPEHTYKKFPLHTIARSDSTTLIHLAT